MLINIIAIIVLLVILVILFKMARSYGNKKFLLTYRESVTKGVSHSGHIFEGDFFLKIDGPEELCKEMIGFLNEDICIKDFHKKFNKKPYSKHWTITKE